jgi:hypothetical protein
VIGERLNGHSWCGNSFEETKLLGQNVGLLAGYTLLPQPRSQVTRDTLRCHIVMKGITRLALS